MSHHYYRQEPNVRFSPDKSLVIFTSNMFGASYVFGAEVAKADNPPRTTCNRHRSWRGSFQPGRSSQQQGAGGTAASALMDKPLAFSC